MPYSLLVWHFTPALLFLLVCHFTPAFLSLQACHFTPGANHTQTTHANHTKPHMPKTPREIHTNKYITVTETERQRRGHTPSPPKEKMGRKWMLESWSTDAVYVGRRSHRVVSKRVVFVSIWSTDESLLKRNLNLYLTFKGAVWNSLSVCVSACLSVCLSLPALM